MQYRATGFRRGALLVAALLILSPTLPGPLVTGAAAAPPAAASTQDAAAALATGLRALNDFAAASQVALTTGDATAAREAYALFDSRWFEIEDGVRERSRDDYRSIEDAMREVDRALRGDPVDTAQVTQWLTELQNRVNQFVATLPGS